MHKLGQLICLIVVLVLMSTNCMARIPTNEAEIDDRVIHFVKKSLANDDCSRCRSTYLGPCYRDNCDGLVCVDVCRTPGDDCTRCRNTYLPPCYRDVCDAHVCVDVCANQK